MNSNNGDCDILFYFMCYKEKQNKAMTKLTPERKQSFLKKNKWHQYLRQYRLDHPELKGKRQQDVVQLARLEYHPSVCPTCRRSFEVKIKED